MLFDLDGRQITSTPHKADYDHWSKNITHKELETVIEAIQARINDLEIFNASFLPGADWNGTPFMPLYIACNENEENAAYFYGIMCWIAVQRHAEEWICIKDKENKILGRGWTYFKKKQNRPLNFSSK